jgi:hypothetical protein
MSEIPPIAVRVFLETGQVVAGAQKTEKALKGIGDQAEKTSKKGKLLGGVMKGLAAVGISVGLGSIVRAFDEMGKAAAADAKSQALLANAMENVLGANTAQIASVENSIQKFSSLYAVLDDQIRPAMSQFVRVTNDATKATEMTNLALNVAAGTGRDLQSVTLALGKAYQGNTGALSRLGLNVKGMEDPLGELAKKFDGAAEAAANLDPYQRMKVAMDNTQEAIGEALLPAMNKLADFMNSDAFADGVANVADDFADFTYGLVLVQNDVDNFVADMNKSLNLIGVDFDYKKWNDTVFRIWAPFAFIRGLQERGNDALAQAGSGFNTTTLEGILSASGSTYKFPEYNADDDDKKTGTKKETPAQKLAKVKAILKETQSAAREAQNSYARAVADSYSTYNSQVAEITQTRNKDLADLEKSHADNMISIQKDYAARLNDIVQQSMDQLRNAFKSASQVNVGALFAQNLGSSNISNVVATQMKDGIQTAVSFWGSPSATAGSGVSGLLDNLTQKLAGSRKLVENAGSLSGAGFSQTFIQSIVSQGADAGNKMAEALLNATPEMQKNLQSVFAESEKLTESGMDALAKAIYDKSGLATNELKNLYLKTQSDLVQAMADEQAAYVKQQADIQVTFTKALAEANKALTDALSDAGIELNKSLDKVTADMNKKLAPFKSVLNKASGSIATTKSLIAGSYSIAAEPTIPDFNTALGQANATLSGQNITNNYYVQTDVQTSDSPEQYAQAVTNAIKFGTPMVLA